MQKTSNVENVVIIGGGPAGLSAATYTSRANLEPLVFAGSPPGGQLTLTSEVENFPGIKSILGAELIEKMREQAKAFNTRIIDQNIKSIDISKRPFIITPAPENSQPVQANSIIIATGAKALWLGLPSEERLRGKGVSACATCDGFFFRGKTVAVIGGGDTAMEDAMTLTNFATKIYVIHRRGEFRASQIMQDRVKNAPKIEIIWNAAVTEILGEEKVNGLTYKDSVSGEEKTLTLDGVFVAIGHKPDTDLVKDKVILNEKGYILNSQYYAIQKGQGENEQNTKTDVQNSFDLSYLTMTSVPGVFAAGDCVDYIYRQAATSAGMGVQAALDVERWLQGQQG